MSFDHLRIIVPWETRLAILELIEAVKGSYQGTSDPDDPCDCRICKAIEPFLEESDD